MNTIETPITKEKVAALVADAFQDSEYFLPKIALQDQLGLDVEVISLKRDPIEIYSNFLCQINDQKKLVASICRGSLLVAKSVIAKGRHLTGFHLDKEFPDLVIRPIVEASGGIWSDNSPVVVDGNLVSSRHPNDIEHFVGGIRSWLSQQSNSKTNLK
jgi:putative intracellular protease/amidase